MEWKVELYIVLLMLKLVHGVKVMTAFTKVAGDGDLDLSCARTANDREYMAVMMDASNKCTPLDWNWGSDPSYETGATYYEKMHAAEIYETPMVLQNDEPVKLPIRFFPGASIHMYINFTRDDFTSGFIQLVDTLDDVFDWYSGPAEASMIRMIMKPQDDARDKENSAHVWVRHGPVGAYEPVDTVILKTMNFGWETHGNISPYPFPAGTTHKITFRALTKNMRISVDNVEVVKYTHIVPPEGARMLMFANPGLLLEKIVFNGKQS